MSIQKLWAYLAFILLVSFLIIGCSQDSQQKVNIKSEAGDIFCRFLKCLASQIPE
ncbi:hypothetical protein N752_12970 [Desulforamulus aquiferis]|nr:hypothetical protein N752_12970 [Desulforamulus aquiferis]